MKNHCRLLKALLAIVLCITMLPFNLTPQIKKAKAASTGFTEDDFLKTNGTTIRNLSGQGETIYLRGTNAGGWLVQESWMNPSNASDQKTIMNTFSKRFGNTVRDELLAVYEDNYWTEKDFDNCAELGMSVIRVPFTYMNLCDDNGNLKANAFKRLDWFVENCSKRGIYVILDLHGTFGSQNGMDHSGEINDGYQLYWNNYNRSKTIWLWEQIANHYKGNPAVAAYDLLNEPGIKAGTTYDLHWNLYDEIYKAIRKIDADHIIIMESCWGTSNLPKPTTYGWENVVYEYHHYTWNSVSDYNGQVNSCNSFVNGINNAGYNVPSFVGEFTCFALSNAWDYVLNSFNKNGLHYTSWSYKVTGNSSWGIYNHNPSKVDIYNDSAATIRTKWSTVGANQAWANTQIYSAMKSKLPGTVTPFNKQISEYVSIQSSSNSKYVCAEDTGASPLVADRANAAGWESFKIVNNTDGTVSFLSSANGKYLCAVIDEKNQLLARSSKISTWEKFNVTTTGNNEVVLQAIANNKYVAVNASDSILYANASATTSSNVKFTVRKISDGKVFSLSSTGNEAVVVPPTEDTTPDKSNTTNAFDSFKRVAYFPDWYGDVVNNVQFSKLTHINYAFAIPTTDGNIRDLANKTVVNKLVSTAHNSGVKVLIAVGGWSYNGVELENTFVQATNTDAKCKKLADSILGVVDTYGFDGVDIDWEYPRSNTSAQYETFMTYLKQGLKSRGKLLTAAVVGNGSTGYGQTDKVLQMLDWVNVMAYDGNAGSGHSPYNFAVQCGEYWTKTRGLSKDKVVLGVPFYERPNWASYADIVAKNSENAYKDSAVINGTTVYYNGINTMKDKTTWACNNAGGIMIWEITQDSKNAQFSLLNAIYDTAKALLDKEAEQPSKPSEPTPDPEPEKPSTYAAYDSAKIYVAGDRVSYNGKIFEAKWWTLGDAPDESQQWGVWKVVTN
ncbi:glycosyl hydrolase family 18 protein [Anaerosporobacter sp.]|uniref:glycosyl hydrolase family 18 protein n=1 Tax=Anaerosporobacter sp. TaxID=1872529 RepID=UPI00286F7078|nr:glycosyl hydrolase family 18 protein [Anaerosporobacter sp.]